MLKFKAVMILGFVLVKSALLTILTCSLNPSRSRPLMEAPILYFLHWGSAVCSLRHLPHSYTRADATDAMSFSGTVDRESHEGGLLVAFEGRAPRLGATLRIIGGKPIGKVNSVIGAIDGAYVHIHPISDEIESSNTIGSPVEIAPREKK